MSESNQRSSEDPPGESEGLPSAWAEFRPLVWAILASAALHGSLMGVGYWVSTWTVDLDAEIEWLDTADRLTGIGQKTRDRFAKTERPAEPETKESEDRPDLPEFEKDEEPDLEKALKGDWKPPEPPEPSESEDRESPTSERKRARDEPTESTADRRESQEEASEEEESERPKRPAARAFDDVGNHPALRRKGPNDLPDMRSFAPGNARMTALVRLEEVRGEPYEDAVGKVLRAVPDYRLLLGVRDFDPVRDLDWFFMASPDPRYVQKTFLVVRHRLSTSRVRTLLDRRYPEPPSWSTYRQYPVRDLVPENPHYRDPRKVVLPGEGLAVVARERLLPQVVGPLARDSELLTGRDDGGTSTEPSSASRPSMLAGLSKMHEVTNRDGTIVLLSGHELLYTLPGVGRISFESVRLRVSRPSRPTIDIDLEFENADRARRFADRCPAIRASIVDAIPSVVFLYIDFEAMLRRLDCKPDGSFVNVHGSFTPAEIADLAKKLSPFVPRPPVLEELPEPPEPAADRADAGGRGGGDAGANVGAPDTGSRRGRSREPGEATEETRAK